MKEGENFGRKLTTLDAVFIVVAVMFVLFVNGAVPFFSMPTLGQALWTTGFAQSLANQTLLDLHATNFGYPNPAAIAFGLAGAYPASILIRMGMHPADTYALVTALWLSVAFWGAWRIAWSLRLTPFFSTLVAILWLSMPIIWKHADYSMVSMGIALLSFYFYSSLRLFVFPGRDRDSRTWLAGIYFLSTIIAVFMDGYSFVMFAVGSSIIALYAFLVYPENRRFFMVFGFPIHVLSFGVAFILYVSYLGQLGFRVSSLDFFRGWGADVMFLAVPTQGVHWIWDILGLSAFRTPEEQFGDRSVWVSTFALPVVIAGTFAWFRTRKELKISTGFLLVGLFAFYMGLGPSLKLNSIKPAGVSSPLMEQQYAVAPTGNALLSEFVPGFKSMRASYRWTALGFLGFWLLIILLLSREQSRHYKWLAAFTICFLILSNLPNVFKKSAVDVSYRNNLLDIESSLLKDLERDLRTSEVVAFLPYRNDFLVNYLASRLRIHAYNIGGDKNLYAAKEHWPNTMSQFEMGVFDKNFSPKLLLLLGLGEADAVVLPYIDLLVAAHYWPAETEYKKEIKAVITQLDGNDFLDITNRDLYSIVRLKAGFANHEAKVQLTDEVYQKHCFPPHCLLYEGSDSLPSQAGSHTGHGMQTLGQPGYLIYGPYKPMHAGQYILTITGSHLAQDGRSKVDLVWNETGETFARFELEPREHSAENRILLQEKVVLYEDVDALELRIHVDEEVQLLVDGYSLRPVP